MLDWRSMMTTWREELPDDDDDDDDGHLARGAA